MSAKVYHLQSKRHPKQDPHVKVKPVALAMEDVPARFRGAVVTEARAKTKRNATPTERQVRQLRFLWMRGNLLVKDLPALNWMDTGLLVCKRLIHIPDDDNAKIQVTKHGEFWARGGRKS